MAHRLLSLIDMSKGIYTAVSGAIAQSARLDTTANNLANVNTPGFKKDRQVFSEYLTAYEKQPTTIEVPRVPASIESFYDMQGGDKSYVDIAGTSIDFSQGALKQTGNPLDLAVEGDGLFEVLTPQGVKLTRAGSFSIDADGVLVTKQGFPVLRDGGQGQDPQTRVMKLTAGNPTVSFSGEVYDNGQSVGKLALVNVNNRDALQKIGNNLFSFIENIDPELTVANDYKVHQGFVEGSNVNMIQEMTEMLGATRTFETLQKGIQAYDQMAQKLVNDVPKLRT